MTDNFTDEYWISKTLELAGLAEQKGEVPVGAIVVKDNQLIGEGYNQPIATHDATAHAEIIALRQAGQYLKNYRLPDTTLYVSLEPCAMCAMAIVHARVKRVVYAASDPRSGAAGSIYQLLQHPAHNHQVELTSGILAEQSAHKLKAFFQGKRKK